MCVGWGGALGGIPYNLGDLRARRAPQALRRRPSGRGPPAGKTESPGRQKISRAKQQMVPPSSEGNIPRNPSEFPKKGPQQESAGPRCGTADAQQGKTPAEAKPKAKEKTEIF